MNAGPILIRFLLVLTVSAAAQAAGITPVRIEQTIAPQFPAALAYSPINSGEAHLVINVDAEGKLVDLLVASYTHEAFANEAVRLLKEWRYTAAAIDGQPVGVRLELKFAFAATQRAVSLTVLEAVNAKFQSMGSAVAITRVCRPHELDQPLAAVQSVSPRHPASAVNPAGSVMIDFYIDEKGQPRMPVVLDSPPRAFAQAAVDALSQWRFTSPTRAGRPVAVRVKQEFVFPANS